ncbi:hypothetical protein COCCADRAFT_99764 [Bipolaris zeicola 26-R-13]|uniref:Uncharacterized protein n=1 Tax=Cochliobolus carbonum (strain 26-R-13) TaxID=930089 RepID=W6Y273_COCC2|nr:uncharacterized protein COCCADRAFT_99764 [Bipolaris zeicola 26-R-13]EUC32028.1 hypothetical protein COCCADRAFT_99764 [Bipolaris zeicola 26-R-13]
MSLSRIGGGSTRTVEKIGNCLICQFRQFTRTAQYKGAPRLIPSPHRQKASTPIQIRKYATKSRFDAPKARADVDERSRLGFYTLAKQQGTLKMEPRIAQSLYQDFVTHKNKMDHGTNILRLVKKYNVALDDVSSLGIITFKIPDISDPVKRAQIPPSQHKTISGLLLQGCAQAGDPLAIVHILTAVYLSSAGDESVQELARLFPRHEVPRYRQTLESFDQQTLEKTTALWPEVLTLKGLFLEQEGQRLKAKEVYLQAINPSSLKYEPGARHPMQLPLIAPWNALGLLLKSEKDPKVQAEAKTPFELGALKGDDPLSYYELAAFEPRASEKWLRYTSKAAASGHQQAMINLIDFYQEVAKTELSILKDGGIRKALNWLLGWKPGSAAALAREWLEAASNAGHKPSMLQLADYHDSNGDHEQAKEYLRQILEVPSAANQKEEWPRLVQLARKRLAGVR